MKGKPLNFTCKEKLSHLLSLKKGDELQTIRKAWKEIGALECPDCGCKDIVTPTLKEKPPKYKVGDIVDYGWDLKSKYEWFIYCYNCKKSAPYTYSEIDLKLLSNDGKTFRGVCPVCKELPPALSFNKNLGKIKITEVFKIEMDKEGVSYHRNDESGISFKEYDFIKDFAIRDGFNSKEEMFNCFDKKYDLSTPKEFYVYRGIIT